MKRRTYIIILCILGLLLINSCTSESFSQSSDPAANQKTEQESGSNSTGSDTNTGENEVVENTQTETPESTEEQELVGGVERVEEAEPVTTPVGTTEEKTITLTIKDRNGNSRDVSVTTDAGDLLTALKTSGQGADAEQTPGYIVTVGGKTADQGQYEWWQVSKDGKPLSESADRTPINNGDHYVFTLMGPE